MIRQIAVVFLAVFTCSLAVSAGDSNPHAGQGLVVARPDSMWRADGQPATAQADPEAAFGNSHPLTSPVVAPLAIRRGGKYEIWVRLSSPVRLPPDVTFRLTCVKEKTALLDRRTSDLAKDAANGGQAGYTAFMKKAQPNTELGKTDPLADDSKSPVPKESSDDLLNEIQGGALKPSAQWWHFTRIEKQSPTRPAYWWKVGTAELKPGEHELVVTASGRGPESIHLETVFAGTATGYGYPFRGDIDSPPGSYVRFRLDDPEAAKAGVLISATLRVHYEPWSTAGVFLNPTGRGTKAEPHKKVGFTPWYRLQDIERAPGFGPGEAHFLLSTTWADTRAAKGKSPETIRGATQFAVFPHDDYVLREISWTEPEGKRLTFAPDFETYPDQLRTFRDHAREHYDFALQATGGRLFPLTRGELYFGNAWGSADGYPGEYMAKTLRLLGFNCVGEGSQAALAHRKLYGWSSHAGQYWPPVHLPFDEAAARRDYDDYYRNFFDREKELYENVSIFQVADEPGEISREEMSSPLWRYKKTGETETFVDLAGDSWLGSRKFDYHDCVLEGIVEQHGTWIGFRVATNQTNPPTAYAEWRIGGISQNRELNLASSRIGIKTPGESAVKRPGAVVAKSGTPFKIVCHGTSAELYLSGKRMHQQLDLPPQGGFAIVGPAKGVRGLRFRPVRKEEHIVANQLDVAKKEETDLGLDDLIGEEKLPEWAKVKPLREAIAQDWQVGGGMAVAHAAFRKWAAAQDLKPELFGQKSWDDVRLLTVASLVESPEDARLFYWSRRFSGQLTPKMFGLASDAIARHAPNKQMKGFVALSGHSLYFPSQQPLDMFALAADSPAMMPGVSDWMSFGSWRWDSHQAVAFSVAPYNAGARRRDGGEPTSFPMMHCVWPSEFRAYTMLASQCRYLSFYNFGPSYMVTEGYWSESPDSYAAVHRTANRAAQVDDILAHATARPSRVALLYSQATEYWMPQASFADKRASFLALSHEYFQPELVTEAQVAAGELSHYDALYMLDPYVATAAQRKIGDWVRGGGLLWACADAGLRNEFNEPSDLLKELAGLERTFAPDKDVKDLASSRFVPPSGRQVEGTAAVVRIEGNSDLKNLSSHTVHTSGMPIGIKSKSAKVRARYISDKNASVPSEAWLEQDVGRGKVVYLGHRVGLTYTAKAARVGGYQEVWADTGRACLTVPLHERSVPRELVLSESHVMAAPLSSPDGTVVMLYNMRPRPLEDVVVTLQEANPPHSVQAFSGDDLVAVPFEHDGERLKVRLDDLATGQMLLVRRKPAPPDERLTQLRERTEAQLKAEDAQSLSAGAWLAGFFPDWQLQSELVPLLAHADWDVRRAAAESLGRLKHAPAAAPLLAAAEKETDAHALGDQLLALAQLKSAGLSELLAKHRSHSNPFVRRQAARALSLASMDQTEIATPEVLKVLEADTDRGVRREGLEMAARLGGNFGSSAISPRDQADWLAAVARHPELLDSVLKSKLASTDVGLLAIGGQIRSAEVARLLQSRSGELSKLDPPAFIRAAMTQRSEPLTKQLLKERLKLPESVVGYLPLILEHTFDYRLGNTLEDWDTRLKP